MAYDFTIIKEKLDTEEKLKKRMEQIKMQNNYYKALKENLDQARKTRHDFRHHMTALNAFAGKNDIAGLKNIIIIQK